MQCGEDVGRRKACALTLGSVDVDRVLRETRVEVGLCRLDLGTFGEFGDEICGDFLELVEITTRAVLEIERETVAHTITGDHGRLEEEHLCVLKCFLRLEVEIGKDHRGAFRHGVAFFPGLEFDDERAIGRTLPAEEGESGDHHRIVYQRRSKYELLYLAEHLVGAVLRGAGRKGHCTHNCAGIFVRNECGGRFTHREDEQNDGERDQTHGKPRTFHEVSHSFLIALEQAIVRGVEGIEESLGEQTEHGHNSNNPCGDREEKMLRSEQTGHHHYHCCHEEQQREPRRERQTEAHAAYLVLFLHDVEGFALCFLDAFA